LFLKCPDRFFEKNCPEANETENVIIYSEIKKYDE